jgi:hypothetical protein
MPGGCCRCGTDVSRLPVYQRARRGVAYVPQEREIFPSHGAGMQMAARPGKWNETTVTDLFFNLRERLHQAGGRLSGGEQQMFAVARALMAKISAYERNLDVYAPHILSTLYNFHNMIYKYHAGSNGCSMAGQTYLPPWSSVRGVMSQQSCCINKSREKESPMAKYRIIALVAVVLLLASPLASRLMAAEMSGVMMKDGKMMMMKDGKPMGPMDHEMTMSNGTKVMTNGMVKMKNGKERMMKNGQMMTMDGKMMKGGKAMQMKK